MIVCATVGSKASKVQGETRELEVNEGCGRGFVCEIHLNVRVRSKQMPPKKMAATRFRKIQVTILNFYIFLKNGFNAFGYSNPIDMIRKGEFSPCKSFSVTIVHQSCLKNCHQNVVWSLD
jgi:hypothetical protein